MMDDKREMMGDGRWKGVAGSRVADHGSHGMDSSSKYCLCAILVPITLEEVGASSMWRVAGSGTKLVGMYFTFTRNRRSQSPTGLLATAVQS